MRAKGATLNEIATALGVSKSSVSLWVRGVPFTPRLVSNRNFGPRARPPNALQRAKQAEIERMNAEGVTRIGVLSEQAFLAAGAALYAGEGFKGDGCVGFATTDPAQMAFFLTWLRRFFDIDEARLRLRLYLHEGLDIEHANTFWSELTGIPRSQFRTPYRAKADATRRRTKHVTGCPAVTYSCSRTHRSVMGLVRALLDSGAIPG